MKAFEQAAGFASQVLRLRGLIWAMARREMAQRYAGTLGGLLWAVVQPLVTVAVYWFVFSVGFRAQGPQGLPFILYFLGGFIPWLFFQELLTSCASCVVGNAHLVKKTLFPIHVMPVILLTVSSITHAVLLLIFMIIILSTGHSLSLFVVQTLYYYIFLCALGLGLGWLVAALQVFSRDLQQGLTVILNLWFWVTPIVWTEDLLPEGARWALSLNPLQYVVNGYRQSLLTATPMWTDLSAMALYWPMALIALIGGAMAFRRLRPEFADVL